MKSFMYIDKDGLLITQPVNSYAECRNDIFIWTPLKKIDGLPPVRRLREYYKAYSHTWKSLTGDEIDHSDMHLFLLLGMGDEKEIDTSHMHRLADVWHIKTVWHIDLLTAMAVEKAIKSGVSETEVLALKYLMPKKILKGDVKTFSLSDILRGGNIREWYNGSENN